VNVANAGGAAPCPEGAAIVVREAGAADSELLDALTRKAYDEYRSIMEPSAWDGLRAAVESGLASSSAALRLVAECGGTTVGTVLLFAPETESYGEAVGRTSWPEVRLLSVAPEFRGRGIARTLMEACIERARAGGAKRIGLHTSRSMTAAIVLYRAMGFEREPEFDFQPPGAELVEAYSLAL
jgi:GNAT superfamily N-acetyltransferase